MIFQKYFSIFGLVHLVSLAFIFNVIVAYPLWLPEFRTFPQISASDIAISFSGIYRYLLYVVALLSLLLANLKLSFYRVGILVFLFVFLLTVLEDINRLQPYFYFYSWIFIIVSFHIHTKKEAQLSHISKGLFILLGACYLWSGIYKCNSAFPLMMMNLLQKIDDELFRQIPHLVFYAIPIAEILLGIVFLELAFKKKIRFHLLYFSGAILLHLSIILMLWLASWNKIVLSWNLCIIFILIWLFEKKSQISISDSKNSFKKHLLVLFFVGCLPALHIFGYWDTYVSWKLYSGITHGGRYYLKEMPQSIISEKLTQNYKIILYDTEKKQYYINAQAWLLAETHTLVYPEKRYFEKFYKILEEKEK